MTKKEVEEVLGIKITIEQKKECWFIRGHDWSNYTNIKKKPGHRVTYELCVGPIKIGNCVCHKCDRKGCINPDHLFQGTHSDNMMIKGRLKRPSQEFKELKEKDRWKQIQVIHAYWSGRR